MPKCVICHSIHLRNGDPPVLPDVLHGGVSNIIAGDGNGLRRREDICIARIHLFQRIGANLDVLEVRLAVRASGGSHIHCVSFVAGAVEPEGTA